MASETVEFATAYQIWAQIIKIISLDAERADSGTSIPARIHPHVQQLNRKLAQCQCRLGACKECVESRKVLQWTWEKMDAGF